MGSLPNYGSALHVVLFPFMSKGHIIPFLRLGRLLLRRGATITVFTTPANRPFISNSLSDTSASIIDIPFPDNIPGLPAGIESTDQLPSMSLFVPFATSTEIMQQDFEKALSNLPHVTFMVTDGFLWWTFDSASKFGIPRLASFGFNNYSGVICRAVLASRVHLQTESDDELFEVPSFPWIRITMNDFSAPFTDREPKGTHYEFVMKQLIATSKSYGLIVNSFCELEPKFLEYWNRECLPKAWCVGPLCLADPPRLIEQENYQKPRWIKWLDEKLEQGRGSVLYVAFGSQAEISKEQFEEIKIGLEKSGVNFLWVVGKNGRELVDNGFEDRVKDRGMVVKEWVDQREILGHRSVTGFLSHCGWNSVMESICAKVAILTWPMMAEQPLNARMVVEEIKVGLRVETCDGTVRGFVKWEGLERSVRELMEGEMGKVVREKVAEIGEVAVKAMEEGGSSWRTLNELIEKVHVCRKAELKDL